MNDLKNFQKKSSNFSLVDFCDAYRRIRIQQFPEILNRAYRSLKWDFVGRSVFRESREGKMASTSLQVFRKEDREAKDAYRFFGTFFQLKFGLLLSVLIDLSVSSIG